MDGLQAIPMIRERAPEAKILVLSGLEADQVSHTALSLGAHGYLEKGAPVAQVGESIMELCA
jgi:DNA-binding NarL/FixJ family response regulator